MASSITHKTVFILDRSPFFAQSCNQPIEYDTLKSKGSGVIPAAPIYKSLWTCNVEGVQEYLRIVFDIYPKDRHFRVVSGRTSLNPWNCPDTITTLNMRLAQVGPPLKSKKDDSEYSVFHGLSSAIDCLREPTQEQQDMLDNGDIVRNRGRIIYLTVLKNDMQVNHLEEYILEALQHNKMSSSSDLLPIDECELVLVHTVPVGHDIRITEKPCRELNSCVKFEVTSSHSGRHLYNKLVYLCCKHFDLCSTTVTGIPMKEEQNASSSANYDVELLHPATAHDELFKNEHAEGLVIKSKEGLPIDTTPLKWCTPKSNVIELHQCSAAYRICPVDVNSRPSSCLTNFLISGRAVMLEQPRKSGAKVISHMLAAHGGEIFIHSLPTSRSILEDPPSISEGCGGRVTDYRITAFGEFMKENRLAPTNASLLESYGNRKPYLYAIDHLEKSSRCWPMVISETILFNLQNLSQLPQLLVQETLTEEQLLECTKLIYKVLEMEQKNDPLPIPATGSRGKGPKRDELYRQLWSELETLVRSYSDTSEKHNKVLECLLNCKKPSDEKVIVTRKTPSKKEDKSGGGAGGLTEAEQSWKELDRYQQMSTREKMEASQGEKTQDAPPPKKLKAEELLMRSGGQTLLTMWNNRLKTIHQKRSHEFDARLDSPGDKAKLYIHLDENSSEQSNVNTANVAKKQPVM